MSSAIAAAWLWTGATAALARQRPGALVSGGWLLAVLAVGLWVLAAPILDGAQGAINYSGGFPISAVLLWAFVWGYRGALISAGACTAVIWSSELYSTNGRISTGLIYLITALVTAWGIKVMRRNETLRKEAESDLADERAKRLRSEERAEMTARVHDSVLQTLGLIQKKAGDSDQVRSLAWAQERDLRAWLYEDWDGRSGSLSAAVKELAAEIGDRYQIKIDVVTVGDCDLTPRLGAMVDACREAVTNAAKFAGVGEISVYVEASGDAATLFVRDRGSGFDMTVVGEDRRGISESIIARMQRHDGDVEVRSAPGEGTEIELAMSGLSAEAGP